MNASQFVDVIRTEVLESAAQGTIALLKKPPGRRPDPTLMELSKWYNGLPDSDQKRVGEVAQLASHGAVFGFLTILDGLRAIDAGPEKGTLELRYLNGEESVLLNSMDEPPLHDLLQQFLN
jgi:hypothetical protein